MALVQPTKPQNAYWIYLAENRAEFQKKVPAGSKASAVAKLAGEKWKTMTEKEKAPFNKKAECLKAQYEKDLAAFKAKGGVMKKRGCDEDGNPKKGKKGKTGKKEKDPNKPKKPAGGAYGVFLSENRDKIKAALPAGHKITDVTKAAGAKFKALSDKEKAPYEKKYQALKAAYEKAMKSYKPPAGAAEDEEDDDEDEDEDEE
eukprot:gnl/TRDRNA2_/TRDRNA2_43159_c0_seq1.p1 gnl/TRDRNA2_/TRDRNA2_43159_c0~~gnl/TRDRNA2_/TRDRNA2_43159_c0_seq1.p1  ORF type:complete len:202 (+),score=86.44 gnl/TRDRNA2_/TRDRNA2_43159_c0_seq1:82-687(+)